MPHQPRVHRKIITKFQELDYRNSSLFHPVAARPTFREGLTLWLLVLCGHLLLWAAVLWKDGANWSSLLQHWDAGWYLRIVTQGYDEASAAFLPLFPYTIKGLSQLFQVSRPEYILWLGSGFSLLCFLLSLWLLFSAKSMKRNELIGYGAILMFVLSPSSFIFHSFHTEAFFLLLSVLAFIFLQKDQWITAAVWAGLAAMVRHQGVFLAIGIAFGAALQVPGWQRKMSRFLAIGLISGLIWSLTPLLHLMEGRGAFPALSAHQSHWYIADSMSSYFKTFLLANPIQNYRVGSFIHQAFYFILLFGLGLLIRKGRWAEAMYCFLSLAIMPLQGELIDAFRFGAVLFPLLFVLGEKWQETPRWFAWPSLAAYVALNMVVTWQYAISRWAY